MRYDKDELLLHACCAPCAVHVIELLSRSYKVTAFFYNPNIQPNPEYDKRVEAMLRLCEISKTELLIVDDQAASWQNAVDGLEEEPEGGQRCTACFRNRLDKAADIASKRGVKCFATTLTVSPRKNARLINRVGLESARRSGIKYLESDFKKNDGFKKSTDMSRQLGLYRQQYCGCIYSKKNG